MKQFKAWKSRQSRQKWSDYRLLFIILLGTIALILGFIGFTKNGISNNTDRTILDNLYLMFGLFSMNSGSVSGFISWELQISRFLVPLITIYTALLAIASIFNQQVQQIKLWFIRDHIIICGLGKKGYRLSVLFLERDEQIVIIEIDDKNPWLASARAQGAIVIIGDSTNAEVLNKVRLNYAKNIISVIGDEAKNIEVAVLVKEISLNRNRQILNCIIHISDLYLWNFLRQKGLSESTNSNYRLQIFNIYDYGANLIVNSFTQNNGKIESGVNNEKTILIGLGKLGQSIIVQNALRIIGYNEFDKEKIDFTIIDIDAQGKLEYLCAQHPFLEQIYNFESLMIDVKSAEFLRSEYLFDEAENCNTHSVFICLDDDSLNVQSALILSKKLVNFEVPIILRTAKNNGLSSLLKGNDGKTARYSKLTTFSLLEETCTPELILRGTNEILARELHSTYLYSQDMQGVELESDVRLNIWRGLSEIDKDKNRKQADRICLIFEEFGYMISPLRDWKGSMKIFSNEKDILVQSMAKKEHGLWMEELLLKGWVYGKAKSNRHKTNPALMDWELLPIIEKEKNINFIVSLPNIITKAGFQIEAIK